MAPRVSRAGYNPYVTPSNKMMFVKNTKGKLIFVRKEKEGSHQKCGDCKRRLIGPVALRPAKFSRVTKCQRTVNRVYGGTVCADCVQGKILKSFFSEEKKQIKEITQ
ncbi:large subunit ribosomal protein L34e [Nematocida sp. LUAm3]|nr:large subunit ribosomal protein L34e [Nematocida sp. LUAm3]KAI5173895.1 large subunit ribosomal protein L34e [Nematocida sp. LUAm2]KAI5177360.1 large subunit ribosomal protein L34e [Nematocida sp. LUAm1]